MTHAIIRGNNGRRHEVDFGDAPIRIEVYASEETVEIFVEAFRNARRTATTLCDNQHPAPPFQRSYRGSGTTRPQEGPSVATLTASPTQSPSSLEHLVASEVGSRIGGDQ